MKELDFPPVVMGIDGYCPVIAKPRMLDQRTSYEIIWQPKENDTSYKGSYTDAKIVRDPANKGRWVGLVTRTRVKPHLILIDYESRTTVWNESGNLLDSLKGGVHSATMLPDGNLVVCVPYDHDHTTDNLVYIDRATGKATHYDFMDAHSAFWRLEGAGTGYLWVCGRDIPQHSSDASEGKCLLRQYRLGFPGELPLMEVATYVLVDHPDALDYMQQPGWWEGPHDIGHNHSTLWISTESRVVEFDLSSKTVTPSPISHKYFQSEKEKHPPYDSPTNLKSVDINDAGDIVYLQTMGDKSSASNFFLVSAAHKKYTFDINEGAKTAYKARWVPHDLL
ncbi:MAG: hypothetical protein ACRDRQ_27715 [Pseudonocardiaceae bacterium]